MEFKKPEVYLIGETKFIPSGFDRYCVESGAQNWQDNALAEGNSSPETLTECYSRLCYRSYAPGLNPNVTKVREGNKAHIENIIRSRHGSVLEHCSANFVFKNVSRVFTHELVRHRVGVAISQESMRFVRFDSIDQYLSKCIAEDDVIKQCFIDAVREAEINVKNIFEYLEVKRDYANWPFSKKKEITSAIRRLIPDGVLTTIGWTANMRTLRHIIPLRTHPSAEEEIRYVFTKVGHLMVSRYPNLFFDFRFEPDCNYEGCTTDAIGQWKCEYEKV